MQVCHQKESEREGRGEAEWINVLHTAKQKNKFLLIWVEKKKRKSICGCQCWPMLGGQKYINSARPPLNVVRMTRTQMFPWCVSGAVTSVTLSCPMIRSPETDVSTRSDQGQRLSAKVYDDYSDITYFNVFFDICLTFYSSFLPATTASRPVNHHQLR